MTPPSILIPLHVRARALLRATCNSFHHYAGRVQERTVLSSFFSSFLSGSKDTSEDNHSALYISGLPGTGKTALVHDVLRGLNAQDIRMIFVNCMALRDVEALWERLLEEFDSNSKSTKGRGRTKKLKGLEGVENALDDQSTQSIIILDEVDHIAKNAEALSVVFNLSRTRSATLRVIGIANTHTLTSSTSSVSPHVQTLHFPAYTAAQLEEIVQVRLAPLTEGDDEDDTVVTAALKKFLPKPALSLLTKKIATQTGDVRVLFEVLRGAIDKATAGSSLAEAPAITPAHILSALKAYAPAVSGRTIASAPKASDTLPSIVPNSSTPTAAVSAAPASEHALKIRNLGLHARLVLLTLLLALHRLESGLALSGNGSTTSSTPSTPRRSPVKRSQSASITEGPHIESAQLYSFYNAILARSGDAFVPVSRTEFVDILGVLDTVGLVTLTGPAAVAASSPAGGKARRVFGRTNSFVTTSGTKAGIRAQEVSLSSGARTEELLRGLGCFSHITTTDAPSADVADEEIRSLYERERARVSREAKARTANVDADIFAEATED